MDLTAYSRVSAGAACGMPGADFGVAVRACAPECGVRAVEFAQDIKRRSAHTRHSGRDFDPHQPSPPAHIEDCRRVEQPRDQRSVRPGIQRLRCRRQLIQPLRCRDERSGGIIAAE
jgi:hypothetical protein